MTAEARCGPWSAVIDRRYRIRSGLNDSTGSGSLSLAAPFPFPISNPGRNKIAPLREFARLRRVTAATTGGKVTARGILGQSPATLVRWNSPQPAPEVSGARAEAPRHPPWRASAERASNRYGAAAGRGAALRPATGQPSGVHVNGRMANAGVPPWVAS